MSDLTMSDLTKSNLIKRMFICFLIVLPMSVWAQNPKPKKLERQNKPKTITIDGQEIPIAGHNNVNKLIRMSEKSQNAQNPVAGLENVQSRDAYEWLMLRDPKTNKIPTDIRKQEMRFAKQLLLEQNAKPDFNVPFAIGDESPWKIRGPYNIGGRTRALAIDRTDTTRILAGGVAGGMWLSENGGTSWRKTTTTTDLQAVSAIAQDLNDQTGQTWYYGTGEIRGNSAGGSGAPFRGNGIYKSTDGGETWASLTVTASNTPHIFDGGFDYVHNLAVDPTNGDLWAANYGQIVRSQDAGISWDTLLTNTSIWSDIAITPTGDVYATLDYDGSNFGIFHKDAADADFTNITPTDLNNSTIDRTVIGIAPSNEDIVYFLAYTPGSGFLSHTLMKYTQGVGWENRSTNLPAFGGSVGNFNSQGAYDLLIEVHPSDPDIVFVGGTNLYRSTDGFATATNTKWIGGYATNNNVSIYPNQHPDQHVLTFYPNSPNAALSGNDGGVQLTMNILEAEDDDTPVNWESLNNGYYTSQPYAISVDQSAENPDLLMAGFQDNGTWSTTSGTANALWREEFGGDGSFNAMADGGRTRLVSSQNGNTYAFYYDNVNDTEYSSWARITPAGAAGFSFVNPFIIDPNNDKVVYMASASGIWRNSNYTEIPEFNGGSATTNWSQVEGTTVASGSVTTLEASTLSPNIVYFGTSFGEIYRVENAHTGTPNVVDIYTDKGLPTGAVSSIGVDPKDANKVIVAMSNYNIRSIFYSEDGGENWVDIAGNLESAEDGNGAGPSVRWVEMVHTDNGTYYLAGTSTGLYSTQNLAIGETAVANTEWELESPDMIGNVVIRHMAVRPYDGRLVVATHANGMYESTLPVTPTDRIFAGSLDDLSYVLGTDSIKIDIRNLFVDEGNDNSPLEIEVYENTNDTLIAVKFDEMYDFMTIIFNDSIPGNAGVTLQASSDERFAFSSFGVALEELRFGPKPVFFQAAAPSGAGITSQVFTDLGGPVFSADDFQVPADESWDITQVYAPGSLSSNPLQDIVVQFWSSNDQSLLPEAIIHSDTIPNSNGGSDGNLLLDLRAPINLTEGYYWVSITPILAFSGNSGRWFWDRSTEGFGKEYHLLDPANLFGAGFTSWTSATDVTGGSLTQLTFALNGTSSSQEDTPPVSGSFVEATSASSTKLSWTKGAFDLAYIIFTSDDGVNFLEHGAVKAEANNNYSFKNLAANRKYYYGIKTIDVIGDTTAIAIDSALTYPKIPVLHEAINITSTGFDFKWDQADADSLIIQIADGNGFVDPIFKSDTLTVSADTTYQLTGLDVLATYQFRLAAANKTGYLDFAQVKQVTTLPSTPLNFTTTSINKSEINLKWDLNEASEGITGYRLLKGSEANSLIAIDTLVATAEDITNMYLAYQDAQLESNTNYYYGIEALAQGLNSETATLALLTLPNQTTANAASEIANNGFTANWSAVSTGSYAIDVATDEAFLSLVVDGQSVESANTSVSFNTLISATTYYYRVATVNNTGTQAASNIISTTTLPDAPANFATAAITNNSLSLTWDAADQAKVITGYKVLRGTSAENMTQIATTETNSYADSQLTGNTLYMYQVIAYNASGDSEALAGTALTLPDAPTATEASSITNTSLQANWESVSGDGYKVDVATDDQFATLILDHVSTQALFVLVEEQMAGKTLFLRVRAYNETGHSENSNTIEMATSISTPADFTITEVGLTNALASWATVEGVTNYNIDISTDEAFNEVVVTNSELTELTLAIADLEINTQYYARLRSLGVNINSAYTEIVDFMTFPELPSSPTAVGVVENSQGNVEVSWNLTQDDVIDYILIERSKDGEQSYEQIDRLEGNPTSYTDTSLPNLRDTYYYRLKAGNRSGTSDYSEGNANFILATESRIDAAISVWPNPTRDKTTLRLNEAVSGITKIDILNASGKVVKTLQVNKTVTTLDVELEMAALPTGVYFIQIATEQGSAMKRIMKQ